MLAHVSENSFGKQIAAHGILAMAGRRHGILQFTEISQQNRRFSQMRSFASRGASLETACTEYITPAGLHVKRSGELEGTMVIRHLLRPFNPFNPFNETVLCPSWPLRL